MIRFIATDLDGTLLDNERKLPEEIFPLVEKLFSRGILFAAASGRQYANLAKLFTPVADKMLFICENGALVKYRGETLCVEPVDPEKARYAVRTIRTLPRLHPLLCGENSAYIDSDDEPFSRLAKESYTNCERVENVEDCAERENICKISVFDDDCAERSIDCLKREIPDLRVILSGHHWCDVSSPEADKGKAIRVIRERFNLKKEECAAFGDHMNDYEMLLECGRPFVPANGYPPLKDLIGNVVPSNEERGVLQKLGQLLTEGTI